MEESTIVQSSPDPLSETRISQTNNPRWHWTLIYDYLKNYGASSSSFNPYTDLQGMMGFYAARHGRSDSFLFNDPDDNSVVNQTLSLVTDGSGNFYSPIQRNLGGLFLEDITDLNPLDMSGLVVKANGVTKTIGIDFNVVGPDPSIPGYAFKGLVIAWAAMPTAPITASFSFYFRVRYESDKQDFEKFLKHMYTIGGSEGRNGSGYLKLVSAPPDSVPAPAVVVARGPKPAFIQSAIRAFDQSANGDPAYLTTDSGTQVHFGPGLQTVELGSTSQIFPGTVLNFKDSGGSGENVTVLAVSGNKITAVFANPHIGEELGTIDDPAEEFEPGSGDFEDPLSDPDVPGQPEGETIAETVLVSLRSLFVTLPFNSQVGDVVFVSFGVTPALNATPFTITDNLGNVYTQVAFVAGTGFGNTSGGVYMTTVTVPGRITVQLILSGGFQIVEMMLDSYVWPLIVDQIVSHTDSGNGGNSNPVTTTSANELLYSIGIAQGLGPCVTSFTAPTGGGWTTRDSLPVNSGNSSAGCGLASWDKTVSSIGTYAADPSVISPGSGPGSGGVSAFLVFLITFR